MLSAPADYRALYLLELVVLQLDMEPEGIRIPCTDRMPYVERTAVSDKNNHRQKKIVCD